MNIYVYSDESGVFDNVHGKVFVFGGLLFLSKEDAEEFAHKYLHAERALRTDGKYDGIKELKASAISNKDKGKLFRSTGNCLRFGVVVHMGRMLPSIFKDKKSKQRYLDYAFKIGLKRYLQHLMNEKIISGDEVKKIIVSVDEHTTATNGIYELREALLQEFKYGTYNESWDHYFPPILPALEDIQLSYCDSSKKTLVRTADIIANRLYHEAINGNENNVPFFVVNLP